MQFQYPIGGLDQSLAYARQPPNTTPDAVNQRPYDVFENRGRGGTRPGLDRANYTQLGSGNPIRLLNTVNLIGTDNFDFWADSFAGSGLSAVWDAGQFAGTPNIEVINSRTLATVDGTTELGASASTSVLTNPSYTAYRVGIFIVPYEGEHNATYRIHARMDASSPDSETDGIICELVLAAGGIYSGVLKRYVGGVLTSNNFSGGTLSADMPGWFELDISSTTTVKCYWRGAELVSQTGISAAVGQRFGFSMVGTTSADKACVDRFRVQYFRTSKYELIRPIKVASSNGTLYRETYFDVMQAVSTNPTLLSTDRVMCADMNNKLWIADWSEPLASGTNGTNTTTSFDSASYADWTTLGIDTDDHSLHIVSGTQTGANETLAVGMHPITTVASGALTLTTSPGPAATAITFRVLRHPKVYDRATDLITAWTATRYSTGTIAIVAGVVTLTGGTLPTWIEGRSFVVDGKYYAVETRDSDTQATLFDNSVTLSSSNYYISKGSVPIGCRLMAKHGGRIYLAGDPTAPTAWYACAEGDPEDWDFSVVDNDQAAMSGPLSEVGEIGDPIIALCPWHRDLMMFGCRNSLWLLSGNPRVGTIQQVSQKIGVVEAGAWCTGPQNELVFLSRDGLYITNTTCLSCEPTPLSRGILPEELRNLSPNLVNVHMEYSVADRGIEIFITHKNSRDGVSHWWFDLASKTLWKQNIPKTMEPTAICYYSAADAEDDCVLLGCRDGYLRRYRDCAETDEGTEITNYVDMGPFALGAEPGLEGQLQQLQTTLSEESGDVTVSIRVGRSEAEAFTATARWTATISAGTGPIRWPKLQGAYAFIRYTGGSRPFGFERGNTQIVPLPKTVR